MIYNSSYIVYYILYILINIISSTNNHDCIFNLNNNIYDLSPLKEKAPYSFTLFGRSPGSPQISEHLFSLGMCDNDAKKCEDEKTDGAPGLMTVFDYQGQKPVCKAVVAIWENRVPVPMPIDGDVDGFILKFANGEKHDCASARTLELRFVCNKQSTTPSFTAVEDPACNYIATFDTKHACGAVIPPPEKKTDNSISGGWIFIILLLCITFIYFCLGSFTLYNQGQRGLEIIPHRKIWFSLPSLCMLGVKVSTNTFRYSCRKLFGKTNDNQRPLRNNNNNNNHDNQHDNIYQATSEPNTTNNHNNNLDNNDIEEDEDQI